MVDGKLSVHNVTSPKIADVSIIPHNVGAHTVAMVIGEKAAKIFTENLDLCKY